jgi:integrative and conjugative element protein (TIGR02256 family)
MKLIIDQKLIESWKSTLLKAKQKEIGGVLFGEHIGDKEFRLVEFTLQSQQGGEASFRRIGCEARKSLKQISQSYGNDHTQFNYLGEWHSHPNSLVIPSEKDCETMHAILDDESTSSNFLVLMILKINHQSNIELSASTFLASGHILECQIAITK